MHHSHPALKTARPDSPQGHLARPANWNSMTRTAIGTSAHACTISDKTGTQDHLAQKEMAQYEKIKSENPGPGPLSQGLDSLKLRYPMHTL